MLDLARKVIASAVGILEGLSPVCSSVRLRFEGLDYSEQRSLRMVVDRLLTSRGDNLRLLPSDHPGWIEIERFGVLQHVWDPQPLEEWSTLASLSGR
jgi:hypothetical protein